MNEAIASYKGPQPEQPGQSVLVALFEYNAWANMKLIAFCGNLTEEHLGSSHIGGYGSIARTLQHMIIAEADYVTRTNGKQPPYEVPTDRFADFDGLSATTRWANEEMLQLALATLNETLVVEEFPGEGSVRYRLADLAVQAPNHSMEHRTQIAAILTNLGMEPPAMDTWAWMEERGAFEETRYATSE